MPQLRVLIVGASVAGPTAAYWFAKAGAKVTVIERFPELRQGGQNIDIRSVGVEVMRQMPGMEEAVRAKLAPIAGFNFVDDNDKSFAAMHATGDPDQQSLVSEYEIFRGDLSQILFDLVKGDENVEYIYGEQVAAMDQPKDDGAVTVTFANGLAPADFDLVVACDGSTSRTRAIGLDCGVRDHIVPINSWAAFFSVDKDFLDGRKVGDSWCTTGGRFVGVGPDHREGCNRVIVMSIHPRNDKDATQAFRDATKVGTDALKKVVKDEFGGAGWKCDEIIDKMMVSDDFYASEIVQVKVPSLYKGRFALVGDAGYAGGPTGAGTSLAMAGAYVLAGEICKHGKDISAGLKAYEDRMKPIIDELQQIPAGFPGVMAPQTRWRIWLRNIALRVICWSMKLGKYFSWIPGLFIHSMSNKTQLPTYKWAHQD